MRGSASCRAAPVARRGQADVLPAVVREGAVRGTGRPPCWWAVVRSGSAPVGRDTSRAGSRQVVPPAPVATVGRRASSGPIIVRMKLALRTPWSQTVRAIALAPGGSPVRPAHGDRGRCVGRHPRDSSTKPATLSPASSSVSAAVSPTVVPASVTSASARGHDPWESTGPSATGTGCSAEVRGIGPAGSRYRRTARGSSSGSPWSCSGGWEITCFTRASRNPARRPTSRPSAG
jgi:hypothetical protein